MNLEDFHFLRPAWLLALALLVPLAWWWRRQRSDAGGWGAVCEPHLLAHLLVPGSGRAAVAPFGLLAVGWSAACLALAGPTWQRLPQPAFGDPARTVFVLSLAPSMDRDDVAPSRLARARHKLGDAIDRLDGGAVGLVVFREEAYAAVPLTDDADVVREMLPRLRTDLAPGREILPSRGLAEARKLLEGAGLAGARIVLVSDGSDASPQTSVDVAHELSRAGATVSVLSLVAGDASGLADVAEAGGGELATLTADDADLERLLAPDAVAPILARLSRRDVQADTWWDAGAWLVWIPLLLAAFGFRRGWLAAAVTLAWIGLPSASAQAGAIDWFQRPDQLGARAFEAGRYADSAASFQDPAWRAAALYRAGDFERAAKALEPLGDERSQYNLGNALARAGKLEEALAAYERSLAKAPGDEDARFNRDLVRRLLDQQRQRSGGGDSGGDDAKQDPGDAEKDRDQARSDPGDGADQQGQERSEPGGGADERDQAQSRSGDAGDEQGHAENDAGDAQKGRDAKRNEPGEDGSPPEGESAPRQEPQRADAGAGAQRESGAIPPGADASAAGSPQEARGAPDARSAPDPWLAHLPDDPGGLLREKLRRDYLRKREARLRGELP